MPAPRAAAVQLGAATPRPKKRPRHTKAGRGFGAAASDAPLSESDYDADATGCDALVWDEHREQPTRTAFAARFDNLRLQSLPSSDGAPAALACQALSVPESSSEAEVFPGWSSGVVELAPRAVKGDETVGVAEMVFFVGTCQAGSLEVALAAPDPDDALGEFDAAAAQRFLLSPGDQFHVPPNNTYRLENRSTEQSCKLFFCQIKPVVTQTGDLDSGSGG